MSNRRILLLSVMFLLLPYLNKTSDATIYVQGSVGTQGFSVGASYYYKNLIGVRGVFDWIPGKMVNSGLNSIFNSLRGSEEGNGSSAASTLYDYGFDLSVRPFRGAFRIDAGIRIMDYKVKLYGVSQVTNERNIYYAYKGNNKFVFAEGVKPYVGLGWDFNPVAGLIIGLDVGVIYTGNWKTTSITPQLDTGKSSPADVRWVEEHRPFGIVSAIRNIKDMEEAPNETASKVCVWPVLKFNVGYKFDII